MTLTKKSRNIRTVKNKMFGSSKKSYALAWVENNFNEKEGV